MILVIKNALLFIGAMIGAGFATGAELMVFFGDGSIWSVLSAGVITTIMAYVFCLFGKIKIRSIWLDRVLSVVIYLSSIVTFIAMLSGANMIMQTGYGVPLIGLVAAIAVSVISIFDMDKVKIINAIIMPIVIIMVIVFVSKSDSTITHNSLSIGKAMTYVGMNLLLSGFLLAESSREMSGKQCLVCCGLIGVVITALITVMLSLARLGSGAMPIIEFARQIGYNGAATIIVFFAIITTMIGAAKIIHDKTSSWISLGKTNAGSKLTSSVYMILLSIITAKCSFEMIVKNFYPLTGYVGVVVCMIVVSMVFIAKLRQLHNNAISISAVKKNS